MSLLFILFYYVNWKPNDQGVLIRWVYPVHTRDHDLKQTPGCWDQGQLAKTEQVRGTGARWAIIDGGQHYPVPCSGTIMDPDIHSTRPSQPSSLSHSHVIFIIFKLHNVSGIRTMHDICNMIIEHELCWYHKTR